jgi:hypothetical protein
MKKFKNTPIKVEPAKPELVKIITTKPEPSHNLAAKSEAPKVIVAKPEVQRPPAARPEPPKIGRVSLEFVKPEAKRVCVAGSFNDWSPEKAPLVSTGNGRWVTDLTLKPGRHEYLFVVDGQWIPDPNAKESVQNPFGGRNSILGVSE